MPDCKVSHFYSTWKSKIISVGPSLEQALFISSIHSDPQKERTNSQLYIFKRGTLSIITNYRFPKHILFPLPWAIIQCNLLNCKYSDERMKYFIIILLFKLYHNHYPTNY